MTLHEVNDTCGDCWAESREVTSTVAYRAVSHSALFCLTSLHIPKGPLWRCFWIPPVGSRNWLGSCRGLSSYNLAHGHAWLRPSL